MFSNQTAELSLNRPVAALDAIRGDKVNSKFVLGTSSVRISEDNHLLLLRFHSEANQLGIDGRLSHPTGPIECIQTSPSDPSYVLTTAEKNSGVATLWKIPSDVIDRTIADADEYLGSEIDNNEDYFDRDPSNSSGIDSDDVTEMEERATLKVSADGSSGSTTLVDIAWRKNAWDEEPSTSSSMGDVATLNSSGTLIQWDVNFGSAESTRHFDIDVSLRLNLPPRMVWDPHQSDVMSISTGDIVRTVDWREGASTSKATSIISKIGHPHHRYGVTDLDYNPNKPNLLVTSGKDGLVKFWDLRKTGGGHYDVTGAVDEDVVHDETRKKKQRPLLVARGGHRHWTSRVLYNPFHDQLVLSAGMDSLVNLWRISTISSAPLLTFDDEQQQSLNHSDGGYTTTKTMSTEDPTDVRDLHQSDGPNVRVSRYEHLDSVKAIAWGAADAWVYMSASYDGKVVLNHVPSKEKYKILL